MGQPLYRLTLAPSAVKAQPPIIVDIPLGSLKTVPTPEPANLNQFLKTDLNGAVSQDARTAAIALGKALFWDSAVGSDGTACATCHFNAGADSRSKNQLDPRFSRDSVGQRLLYGGAFHLWA